MASSLNEQDHFNAAKEYQGYYDGFLRTVGGRAPQPILGQTVGEYRRETLRTFKRTFLPQNHDLYQVQFRALRNDSLAALEPQLLEACVQNATNPQTLGVQPGEYREVKVQNPYTDRVDAIKFVGHWDPTSRSEDSFVKYMGRPGRHARIRNPTTDPGWFPKEVPSVFLSGRLQVA
jgi:hypothetical protein